MFTRKPKADPQPLRHGAPQPLDQGMPLAAKLAHPSPPTQRAAQQTMPGGKAASQSVAAQEEGLVVIGKGTRVHGKIGDCRKLDVHGILEADVVADTLVVREGGGIKGTVQTDNMEIYGVFEGTLIVHEHLSIESTGHVTGEISYRTLAIQTGAQVNGTVICREQEVAAEPESATTADIIPINGAHRTEINGGDLGMQNSGAGSWAGQG